MRNHLLVQRNVGRSIEQPWKTSNNNADNLRNSMWRPV